MHFFLYQRAILTLLILVCSVCQKIPISKRRIQTSQQLQLCVPPIANTNNIISAGNCNAYQYQIQLGIGTPPQYFLFQFDTGSNMLWVPTQSALGNGFNSSASSTYNITNQSSMIQYADNSQVTGYIGSDFVTVQPNPIYTKNTILFVTKQNDMKFNGGVIGIVGMGYTTNNNFLDIAYNVGQINTSTFVLQLQNTQQQSYVYYNNIPQNITSNTLFSSVSNSLTSTSRWQVEVVGFYAGENDWTSYAANSAIIDSGTSLFYLNTNLFNQFYNTYMQNCTNKTQYYVCHCDDSVVWPNLVFMFAGVQVQINSSEYVIPSVGTGQCDVYMGDLSTVGSQILLGDTLFQNYLITFDKLGAQIGFNGINTVSVPVFGGDHSFSIAQYVMLGINIFLLLWIFLLSCFVFDHKSQSNLREPLNAKMNNKMVYMNNIQMKPRPNAMEINY